MYPHKSQGSQGLQSDAMYDDSNAQNRDNSKSEDSILKKSNPTAGSNQMQFLNNIKKEFAKDYVLPRKSRFLCS